MVAGEPPGRAREARLVVLWRAAAWWLLCADTDGADEAGGVCVDPMAGHDAEAAEAVEALGVRRWASTCEWPGALEWSEQGWIAGIAARQNL